MAGMTLIATILRRVLNASLQGTTPDQLIDAVQTNASLMGNASDQIHQYAAMIPPFAVSMAGRQLSRINQSRDDGIVGLVMEWLAADQPIYHSLLLNMDGGKRWLETQVYEILTEFGIRVER